MLRDDQIKRYSRHVLLPDVGGVGQKRILAATVAIPDAGGASAVAIVYLAAAGVGTLVVRDTGVVTEGDVGALYELADIGRPRAEAAAERVTALNPDVRVVADTDSDSDSDTGSDSDSGSDPENDPRTRTRTCTRTIPKPDLPTGTFVLDLPPQDPTDPIATLGAGSSAAAQLLRAIVGAPA